MDEVILPAGKMRVGLGGTVGTQFVEPKPETLQPTATDE